MYSSKLWGIELTFSDSEKPPNKRSSSYPRLRILSSYFNTSCPENIANLGKISEPGETGNFQIYILILGCLTKSLVIGLIVSYF